MLLENEYMKLLVNFLEARKEGYEKRGLIPTLELLINDIKETMNIKIDSQEAEDVAVDIQVEQDQLEKPVCKKCGSTLVDDGYGEASACTNCA